jgi:Ca2+-binding RTX toxin-like protein
MPTSAADSTQLRTAIQNVVESDPIINLTAATIYSVTTLAKLPSNIAQPALPYSGYTIQSSVVPAGPPAIGSSTSAQLTRDFSNTRIYQQNIDGPYSPGLIKDVELIYTSGTDALLSATTGGFTFTNVRFSGTHSGWAGNGNKYFSLTSFSAAAPITVPLTLTNVSVTISGQNGFGGTNGGSAFLHSWDNNGPVSITSSSFDESGFASTLNLLGTGALPSGSYAIINNSFNRNTTAANRTVRPEGNRLQGVNAFLINNTFTQGSYLDLYGNISGITLTSNTFSVLTAGYGIRVTSPNTGAAPTLSGSNAFTVTGTGLPLKYVNSTANTSYTLTGGTITVGGISFVNLIAGGQGEDVILGTNVADWINGDDGKDSISGLAGNDFILGGAGNDTIEGGIGADTLNGGTEIDTLSYANSSAAVNVILNGAASGGDASGDVISNFENLIGSANADNLTGNAFANNIAGSAGNDTLTGGAGADRFSFGTTLNASTNVDTITDFKTSGADQILLDNAIFTGLTAGTLLAADFGTAAAVGRDIVYTGGGLYFAAGGSGTLAGYTKFATLTGSPTVINSDIVVT